MSTIEVYADGRYIGSSGEGNARGIGSVSSRGGKEYIRFGQHELQCRRVDVAGRDVRGGLEVGVE